MEQVKHGDTVHVHYEGKLPSGELFDSSEGREPLRFTVGSGQVIPGFDKAVLEMEIGQKKTVQIPVGEAYGERTNEALIKVPRTDFPEDLNPEVGQELQMSDDQGHVFPVVVADVAEDHVVLDANHPLAGQELIFDITLVKIG